MSTEIVHEKKLTYADYVQIPEDGCQHEILDGVHFVNPAPNLYHQTVSRRLQFILFSQIETTGLGQVFNAPCDLQLTANDVVQPDLIVVLNHKRHILTPTKIKGIPDLVVEILSPSTELRDRDVKRTIYQRAGVPEYWIVDPIEHVVEQLVLRDGIFQKQPDSEVLRLTVLESVLVKLEDVW